MDRAFSNKYKACKPFNDWWLTIKQLKYVVALSDAAFQILCHIRTTPTSFTEALEREFADNPDNLPFPEFWKFVKAKAPKDDRQEWVELYFETRKMMRKAQMRIKTHRDVHSITNPTTFDDLDKIGRSHSPPSDFSENNVKL